MTSKDLVYEAIVEFIEENKYPPTTRELSNMVGLAPSVVLGYMRTLRLEGKISYMNGMPRTIVVLEGK